MNFNDMPEHILDIFRHNKNKDKNANVTHEFETLTSIEDFNEEVNRKLGREEQTKTEEDLFDTIIGYSDIKKILMKRTRSSDREPVHVILDGPPTSAKTMFLLAMQKKLRSEGVYFVDCTSTTGPGLVDYLFKNDIKFLLLDGEDAKIYPKCVVKCDGDRDAYKHKGKKNWKQRDEFVYICNN